MTRLQTSVAILVALVWGSSFAVGVITNNYLPLTAISSVMFVVVGAIFGVTKGPKQ